MFGPTAVEKNDNGSVGYSMLCNSASGTEKVPKLMFSDLTKKPKSPFDCSGVISEKWSFGGSVLHTQASTGVWPPIGPVPASAGLGPIGG